MGFLSPFCCDKSTAEQLAALCNRDARDRRRPWMQKALRAAASFFITLLLKSQLFPRRLLHVIISWNTDLSSINYHCMLYKVCLHLKRRVLFFYINHMLLFFSIFRNSRFFLPNWSLKSLRGDCHKSTSKNACWSYTVGTPKSIIDTCKRKFKSPASVIARYISHISSEDNIV